jgi:hypothetical protein
MSDVDYDDQLTFSQDFSDFSLEDIPTVDSNEVLEVITQIIHFLHF